MPDLDPAHVEAVALVVDPAAFQHASQAWEAQRGVALLTAEAILTSTDPAVHAALLAALVRAGLLEEEHRDCCSTCGATYGSCANIDEACNDAAWIEQRQYLSKWEETCD